MLDTIEPKNYWRIAFRKILAGYTIFQCIMCVIFRNYRIFAFIFYYIDFINFFMFYVDKYTYILYSAYFCLFYMSFGRIYLENKLRLIILIFINIRVLFHILFSAIIFFDFYLVNSRIKLFLHINNFFLYNIENNN